DAEADQRPDLAAELDRLILGEVAQMLNLDLSVDVLVDRERVDHAHGVALAQPFELGDDLAVELGMAETQNNELNRSDCHVSPFDRVCRRGAADVSLGVDNPPSYPHLGESVARTHRPPWMKRR